jgi:sulfur-carrier protein
VRLLYFAWVREAVGRDEEDVALPAEVGTVVELARWLAKTYPIFADTRRLRVAIDQQMAGFDASIVGATEIAFFPPVTGG